MTPSERAVAEALWRNLDDDFSADAAHTAFIEHCRRSDALAFAAQRYRERRLARADHGEEVEVIDERLKAIAAIAMAQLGSQPAAPPPGQSLRLAVTIVGVILFIAAVAVFIFATQL